MSVDKVQKDFICRLLADLVEVKPDRVKKLLQSFQFKMGDVSFMVTDKGHFWTEVWQWPWERSDYRPDPTEPSANTRERVIQLAKRVRYRSMEKRGEGSDFMRADLEILGKLATAIDCLENEERHRAENDERLTELASE